MAAFVETLAPTRCNHDATDAGMRNPITGIASCCAYAASGHAAAAPPSVAKNFRRSMWLALLHEPAQKFCNISIAHMAEDCWLAMAAMPLLIRA